jgi:hypothetical protein
MNMPVTKILIIPLAAGVASFALLANDAALRGPDASLISKAEAIIGRPLTPMSYAGVARRTTRRAPTGPALMAPMALAPLELVLTRRAPRGGLRAWMRAGRQCLWPGLHAVPVGPPWRADA